MMEPKVTLKLPKKGILIRHLETPEGDKPEERVRSPRTLELKKQQKSVLRQFRKLSPLCSAVREKFHEKKKIESTADLFKSTEDTNILFGPGHTYSNNAATNKYKTRGRHNQCEANRSHQVLTFEPFPEMEGNWHLHRQSECSIHFRPGTGHSGRSSPRPPTNLSRRSSLASRIQSTTFRMKSNYLKSKVASTVSKHMAEVNASLQNGPKEHLETFLDSLDAEVKAGENQQSAPDEKLPPKVNGQGELKTDGDTQNEGADLTIPYSGEDLKQFIFGNSDLPTTITSQKLLRRPMNPIVKPTALPKFDFPKFRPSPFGSAHRGAESYSGKFPISVREMKLVPDYMKETPIQAIMRLPSLTNNGSTVNNLRS